MKLIITIDTEEEGRLWDGIYIRNSKITTHLEKVNMLQSLFNTYGVKPTYLINIPVLENPKAIKLLKQTEKNKQCELGTHIHSWNTPPIKEKICQENTYLCNLDKKLVEQKLIFLTNKFRKVIGHKPHTHKSGRYGLDTWGFTVLEKLGYKIETSITPHVTWENDGGPDFRDYPSKPYYPSLKNIKYEGEQRKILEIPATIRFTRKN